MDKELRKILTGNNLFSLRSIILRSLLGGIAWGVGSVIGATLIIALFVTFLHSLNWVPVIGDIATGISQLINTNTKPNTP